jgi:hypothetical protein
LGKVLWSGCFGNVTQVSRTYIYIYIYIYILHKFCLGQSQPIVSNPTCGIKSRSFAF